MAKRKTKTAHTVVEKSFSASEIADFLVDAVPELRESMGTADIVLALDDLGWNARPSEQANGELTTRRRNAIVAESRLYWHRDPLAKQAVRLWTDYAVGTGITYQAHEEDATANLGNATQQKLNKFFKYRKNKRLTSSRGQQRLSKKLLVDGELFFAVFQGKESSASVLRTIDCLQITSFISSPQDQDEVLCYRREMGAQKHLYYQDWAADDGALEGLKDPETGKVITVESDVVIYHLAFDDLAFRGNGLLSSVVDWSREHRRFMQARVALTQALAKFAHKITAKGGQKMLDQIAGRLQSSIAASGIGALGTPEKNPPPVPGSNWLQNQGVDMTPMPRATGAGDAKTDGDMLKLMVCAGTNIMQHYFGDPSTGNLATAEAMELPMLKSFTGYQELWTDSWRDIFAIVLDEDIDDEPAAIRIDLPAMLKDDLRKMGNFLTGLHQVFPEIQVPEILQACLVALGLNNVEEIMASVAVHRAELAAAAEKVQQAAVKQPMPKQAGDVSVTEATALNRLAAVLEAVHSEKSPITAALESAPPVSKTRKSGKFGRDPVTGEMNFVVEEMAGVTQ